MNIEQLVKETFYKLLLEQPSSPDAKPDAQAPPEPKEDKPKEDKPKEDKPKRKKAAPGSINIAPGSVGRGRFKSFVGEAGARAESDADGLMDDLGVKAASGNTDTEKVKSILQRAIAFNQLMGQAYTGASGARVKMGEDASPTPGVRVAVSEISTRDGIKFISHTLAGAKNAGMLSLEGAIEIGLYDGEIFIKSI